MPLTSLHISNIGPFDEIDFQFDSQVNVFTGPNNSGKSSALWVLGDVTVYPFEFPQKLLRSDREPTFEIHANGNINMNLKGLLPCTLDLEDDGPPDEIYWTRARSDEYLSFIEKVGYSTFIPALRRNTDFRSPGPAATRVDDGEGDAQRNRAAHSPAVRNLPSRHRESRNTRRRPGAQDRELLKRLALVSENASLISDEAVIQKLIEIDYRSYIRRQPGSREILVKLGEIASEITHGFPIQFVGVNEDDGGFFPEFRTIDGLVPLNTLSQGTQSIIQWLAHLLIGYAEYYDYVENLEELPGILIIDEIDAHLHPSWQQRTLPTLTRHFPNLQVFCSTHSPLMLAGLKEGQVQLLQRDRRGRVTVSRNEIDIAGWTADEILRNFLGVHDPTDLAAVDRLGRLRYLRGLDNPSAGETNELEELRHTVSQELMSGPWSSQLVHLAETLKRTDDEASPPPEAPHSL